LTPIAQFNATQYLLGADNYLKHLEDKKGTLHDIFLPKRPGSVRTVPGTAKKINKAKMALADCICEIVNVSNRGKLDLIPSTLELWEIDMSRRGTETRLRSFLEEKATGYDYVIVDCPPTISIFMQAAILASHKPA
jgi:chromosome partitioning protein